MTVDITVPEGLMLSDWALWADVLVAQNAWSANEVLPAELGHLSAAQQQYMAVFLRLSRWMLELARLPIFTQPERITVTPQVPQGRDFQLAFDVPVVDLMPQRAYETAVRVAAGPAVWTPCWR